MSALRAEFERITAELGPLIEARDLFAGATFGAWVWAQRDEILSALKRGEQP